MLSIIGNFPAGSDRPAGKHGSSTHNQNKMFQHSASSSVHVRFLTLRPATVKMSTLVTADIKKTSEEMDGNLSTCNNQACWVCLSRLSAPTGSGL